MDTFVTRYIDMYFHLAKDIVLSVISQIFPKRGNMIIRWVFLFLLLVVIHPFLLFCLSPYPILFKISMSLSVFFFYVFVALFFCKLSLFQRGWVKNGVFIIIFLTGIVCYVKLSDVLQTTTASKGNTEIHKTASVDNKAPQQELSWDDVFTAIHHSHTAVAAFFPSRGAYEIEHDGTQGKNKLAADTLWWYMAFHAAVYIFVGYFIMSLWGYRTINRLRFWLTTDREKNVFWCNNPEPKMLKLAKDIIENMQSSRPVFSVEESMIDKPEMLFQEMNYQGYCLKLRKPGQIHEKCLRASRHFFLSENSDWNILMAENLVNARSSKKYNTATKLYIKIENDARKDYYIRWADQYKSQTMEIIFIDECSLIVDKFTKKYHILAAFPECIDENAAVCKENGFKFLIIGFGGLGEEVLKHLVCDSQFWDPQGNRVSVGIDVVEKDAERIALFQKQYAKLCERFSVEFNPENENVIAAGTAEFYSFFEKNHKKYDRVIVALGDVALNIETIAQIEDIIRKNIDLSSPDPREELKKWKDKLFLISPELSKSIFQEEEDKDKNIFTVIGADNEIFNYSDIINEEMFTLAKEINCRYCGESKQKSDSLMFTLAKEINCRYCGESKQKSDSLMFTLAKEINCRYCGKSKQKSDSLWSKTDFYNRQSSYAAALGLDNTISFLKKNTEAQKYISDDGCFDEKFVEWFKSENTAKLREKLGKMEHERWWAYMLGCGYSTWHDPRQRLGDLEKANQTKEFLRHATMVEWDSLPKMDNIFRNVIKISINKKAEMTSNLLLKAVVCNNVEIEFKDLPIRLPISLPIRGQIVISISCKSSSEKLKENLNKKLHDLSQLTGAEVELELELKNNSGRLLAKKDNQILIEEHKKDVSKMYFAEFSVLEKSSHKVVGCQIKNGIVKIEKIENSENMKSKESQEGDCKEICVEQTLSFSGILQCNSLLEPIKDFQQKDFDLIEDLPYLLGIVKAKECGN